MGDSFKKVNRYYDRLFEREAVKILPGEFFATKDNTLIVTVLGSCVSVCLRDEVANVSGMNHFLLPSGDDDQSDISKPARYGAHAMELLINEMLKMGAKKQRLVAKVFGGGSVIRGLSMNLIGQRNAAFTLDYLNAEHIPIIAQDLLDTYPRKVYFFPEIGEVKVKKIKSMHNSTILDREKVYQKSLVKPANDDISLFE
jgi:chemotaxis protein CheD